MSGLYSEEVMKHFKNPKNMGEIKNADAVATVGSPLCGDVMKLYLKIGKKEAGSNKRSRSKEYIKNVKFQTLGCAAAIATSSVLTEMAKGKTLREAEKINSRAIIRSLGGLPRAKTHCSVLGARALKKAIENYQKSKVK